VRTPVTERETVANAHNHSHHRPRNSGISNSWIFDLSNPKAKKKNNPNWLSLRKVTGTGKSGVAVWRAHEADGGSQFRGKAGLYTYTVAMGGVAPKQKRSCHAPTMMAA
jgi:hypothetical protein